MSVESLGSLVALRGWMEGEFAKKMTKRAFIYKITPLRTSAASDTDRTLYNQRLQGCTGYVPYKLLVGKRLLLSPMNPT
jgi:hypothetical protein